MRPSREELFARLREIYGVTTDEDLAHRLRVRLRTLSRWKKGGTPQAGPHYDEALILLEAAGYLNGEARPTKKPRPRELEALAAELAALEARRTPRKRPTERGA
jgi:hypothetical protein